VGRVIRDRIFRSVLFPAPFRPMMPTTSPCSTVKSTSRRAQKSDVAAFDRAGAPVSRAAARRADPFTAATSWSLRSEPGLAVDRNE
jgi:hypothetical protein